MPSHRVGSLSSAVMLPLCGNGCRAKNKLCALLPFCCPSPQEAEHAAANAAVHQLQSQGILRPGQATPSSSSTTPVGSKRSQNTEDEEPGGWRIPGLSFLCLCCLYSFPIGLAQWAPKCLASVWGWAPHLATTSGAPSTRGPVRWSPYIGPSQGMCYPDTCKCKAGTTSWVMLVSPRGSHYHGS
jgi:hypothetical protein